jgi:hypothetical protein
MRSRRSGDQSLVAREDAFGIRRTRPESKSAFELCLDRYRFGATHVDGVCQETARLRCNACTVSQRAAVGHGSDERFCRGEFSGGKDGKLRALAVSSAQRLPLLPDVPPFAEAAGTADYEGVSWHMLLAPSKTPQPIIDRLHAEMKRIMRNPEMQAKIAALGVIPNDSPSIEDMRSYIQSEHLKWGTMVKQLGLEGSQ